MQNLSSLASQPSSHKALFDGLEQDVRQRLASHLIPFEEMVAGDYHTFLEARAEMIHAEMTSLRRGENLG